MDPELNWEEQTGGRVGDSSSETIREEWMADYGCESTYTVIDLPLQTLNPLTDDVSYPRRKHLQRESISPLLRDDPEHYNDIGERRPAIQHHSAIGIQGPLRGGRRNGQFD